MTSATQMPQAYGYESLPRLRLAVNEAVNVGLIRYDRGFRRSRLGRESSKPEEMLEAARFLGADDQLVKRIRALVAADRIGYDQKNVQTTIDELALSPEERQIAAQILTNHARYCGVKPAEVYSLPQMKPVTELLLREI